MGEGDDRQAWVQQAAAVAQRMDIAFAVSQPAADQRCQDADDGDDGQRSTADGWCCTERLDAEQGQETADGREISIDLSFSLSRQFVAEQQISLKAGDALIDPLVINFAAPAAKLTATKYSFDLDSDGASDQVSFAGAGSGFLALDINKDGVINNGSELFGPQSGDGFGELAAYDSDGNNWIDENDAIYDKLRIWTKDEQGRDQLFALGQKGIGAIYVGNVATEFALKDSANNLQGQMRSTGIFLRENGTAGTIQHIDLAV